MRVTRRFFAAQIAGAAALSAAGQAWADAPVVVRGLAVQNSGQGARILLGLDRQTAIRSFALADPHRFVIDLAARWAGVQAGADPGEGVVRGYRTGVRPDGSARLVLDLQAPVALAHQNQRQRGSALEVSFDLSANAPFTTSTPTAPIIETTPRYLNRRRTIVVDAGHGGHDPGAIGATGVREKDVVLDAALKLRDALESRGNYRVALTRDADRFVPLPDRVSFARSQGADLFISLHADSHANPDAHGASIYTLSERGANRAQNLMATQNWSLDLGSVRRGSDVDGILTDLAQRETTNRSSQFAETAISCLSPVSPMLSNTHRSAGFFVLLAPDVPAVLLETGFLSNIADERRLSDPRAREQIAGAMANAVDGYFGSPRLLMAGA